MSEPTLLKELQAEWLHLLEMALAKIEHCLGQLDDRQIWIRPTAELNSIANLMLHLAGNLNQWAIAGLGGEPDVRNRQAEFADRSERGRREIFEHLRAVVCRAQNVIREISDRQLLSKTQIQGFHVSGLSALSHTVTHFVGHTHQIVQLTRWHLGPGYQFQWTEDSPRDRLPI